VSRTQHFRLFTMFFLEADETEGIARAAGAEVGGVLVRFVIFGVRLVVGQRGSLYTQLDHARRENGGSGEERAGGSVMMTLGLEWNGGLRGLGVRQVVPLYEEDDDAVASRDYGALALEVRPRS
jgi:hypothetical protein